MDGREAGADRGACTRHARAFLPTLPSGSHRCDAVRINTLRHSALHASVTLPVQRARLSFLSPHAKFSGARQPLCKEPSITAGSPHGNTGTKRSPSHCRLPGNRRKELKIPGQPETKRVACTVLLQRVQILGTSRTCLLLPEHPGKRRACPFQSRAKRIILDRFFTSSSGPSETEERARSMVKLATFLNMIHISIEY